MTGKSRVDFLIIGAGVIGVNIALQLKRKYPDCSILVLEKENTPGLHGSGRNSGVLHAGFYYSADSMKARFCREGNRRLTEYCLEKNLPINRCGKLVVAADESELPGLDELLRRGLSNGVELHELDEGEAREIEPRVITCRKALFSPATATVSPRAVMQSLIDDAHALGVQLLTGAAYLTRTNNAVITSKGEIEAGYIVNAAGLYADRIALDYGFSRDYRILPFKGLYLYANAEVPPFRTNIYPVPDLRYPFLGVHFTVDVEGHTKIGPTAIPAFWREQYGGLENFKAKELLEILLRDAALLLNSDFEFGKVALDELKKYSGVRMVELARRMARDIDSSSFREWGKPGIRAQLVNIRTRKLEMDFRFEGDGRSFHVLNAVSPAFTCSMPFAGNVVEQIEVLAA